MVLKPFPDITLGGAGPPGQFGRGCRAVPVQRPVQAKPLAQVYSEQLERPDHVME
jgi:hypothetical protein